MLETTEGAVDREADRGAKDVDDAVASKTGLVDVGRGGNDVRLEMLSNIVLSVNEPLQLEDYSVVIMNRLVTLTRRGQLGRSTHDECVL